MITVMKYMITVMKYMITVMKYMITVILKPRVLDITVIRRGVGRGIIVIK